MRVLNQKLLDAGLAPHERFFVDLWHSMTHDLSLDSYRVKCMNARTLVCELSDEIRIGRIADGELIALCQETIEALAEDAVIQASFPLNLRVISPFLAAPPVATKDSKDKNARNGTEAWKRFCLAAEDFAVALNRDYFRKLIEALPAAVKPGNDVEIKNLLGSFLSDLIDQGWLLESLFKWHQTFLKDDSAPPRSFADNLRFVLKQIPRGRQEFRVTLRITGSPRLRAIESFHEFKLSPEITLVSAGTGIDESSMAKRFAEPNQQVVFATTTVDAVDATGSAIVARAAAEQLLDLLRFDYEHSTVRIEDVCYARRLADGRVEFPRIRHAVPNPRERANEDDFRRLVEMVDTVSGKDRVERVSHEQIVAAMRQYRFGRDSEGYRDKFLNWWLALEALCHTGQGKGIGETVTRNCSRAMMTRYLFRLARDLATTLKYLGIVWTPNLAGLTGCDSVEKLTVSQLVTILQSSAHAQELWTQCSQYPLLVFRGKQIEQVLADPKQAHQRLSQHLRHVEWHLNRIYRIRCCIVHGSPIRFQLGLITANLEFYLKEMIRFVMESFFENDHIENLDECFSRAAIVIERSLAELNDSKATPDRVRELVFADVVAREKP